MYLRSYLVLFFFKQKTAYDLRISDWSSDVCSSDLDHSDLPDRAQCDILGEAVDLRGGALGEEDVAQGLRLRSGNELREQRAFLLLSLVDRQFGRGLHRLNAGLGRSEEHTSELQSLMRISYAVFCLKKKKTTSTMPNRKTNTETKTTYTH